MALKDMYAYAMQISKDRFHGTIDEKDGKLYFKGTVGTDLERNEIWNALKTIPTWQNDIIADIQVIGGPTAGTAATAPAAAAVSAPATPKTYTVKAGDTLSKIAKEFLGSANAYMKYFELNKDQLSDPDKIKPGQVLKLP